MPVTTNADALRQMRRLDSTSTGRLRGLPARYAGRTPATGELRSTPEPWHSRLVADLSDRAAGSLTPDSAEYLVFSDNLLIAVLTVAAHLVLPEYDLSPLQRRHQGAAAHTLTDLPRHTLRELADQRARMDGRDEQARLEYDWSAIGAVRVAAADDPTVTEWVSISADRDSCDQLIRHTGLNPDQLIVISAPGYGRYGRDRHRLDLAVLCAMHRLADRHDVTLTVVGDWLAAEDATDAELDPEQIVTDFSAAYIGPFPDQYAYTRRHLTDLGWTAALQQAGIAYRYLDEAAVNRDWFTGQVRGIRCHARNRTEVFRRTAAA
jgi:hypothetical protein